MRNFRGFYDNGTYRVGCSGGTVEVCDILFSENTGICLSRIEFDSKDDIAYVLGFMRDASGVFDYGFIGMLIHKELKNVRKLTESQYDYLDAYKSWEASGFTKKKFECLRLLKDRTEMSRVSLKEFYEKF